jgi:hypothetical protein
MNLPIRSLRAAALLLSFATVGLDSPAFGFGKSLLVGQLNQLRTYEKDCMVTELDLARAFPQFANGPKKSYRDKNNTIVWANSLEPWFEKSFEKKNKFACQNAKEISNTIDSVHQKAISECAARGKEAVPKWVLGFRAANGDQREVSEGVVMSTERLQLNYQKDGKGDFVRVGVSKSLVKSYEPRLIAAEITKIAGAINGSAHGTGLGVSAVGSGITLGQPGLKPDQIKAIEANVKKTIDAELDTSGIPANISCKNGWCESGGKNFIDDTFKGKRDDWKKTDPGQLNEPEPKTNISTIEQIRTQCIGPDGGRTCSPADDDPALDPLQECVDKEIKAIYDQRGGENRGPDASLDEEELSPMDLVLCDASMEGRALCDVSNDASCNAEAEGESFCKREKLLSFTEVAIDQLNMNDDKKILALFNLNSGRGCSERVFGQEFCQAYKNDRASTEILEEHAPDALTLFDSLKRKKAATLLDLKNDRCICLGTKTLRWQASQAMSCLQRLTRGSLCLTY